MSRPRIKYTKKSGAKQDTDAGDGQERFFGQMRAQKCGIVPQIGGFSAN